MVLGAIGGAALMFAAAAICAVSSILRTDIFLAASGGPVGIGAVAQDDADSEEAEVPPERVKKYISAYRAMQQDHNLAVEQAAAAQGLSLQDFREIERKVENDDVVRERVRKALRREPSAAPSAATQ
jgi:hypothetical protein